MATKSKQVAKTTTPPAAAPGATGPTDQLKGSVTMDIPADAAAKLAPLLDLPKDPPRAKRPEQVTLASLYGFYDDEGMFHSWAEGHVVTDPAHIELLIARGAPLAE